ncbi:hypothetical protein PILCRDRAFT_205485 [Piloderma croceum F 1598]|uniref:Uncharacterized protein n=1 Tax=Piloderma croceum (strain F 1598) TaxID=765440 RepID=A0A0C3GHC0_PILCF|nr:hypothetical protein PILCRDRAFT_205485 [Piloderma croceum F 1598]
MVSICVLITIYSWTRVLSTVVSLLVLSVPICSVSSIAINSLRCLAPLNRFSCLQVPYDNCKVHSPLDCALLGITETAAQLDYGTYKIINRASQSSLCSHETGERIYVSTQGYPCARELWEVGPGDDHGLYTIKNIGLNSCIHANKMSKPILADAGAAHGSEAFC